MRGLLSFGTYLPHWRLSAAAIAATLGSGGGRTRRAVAGYDEDTVSMGVEAARNALRGRGIEPTRLYFATADPPYLDKTNAAVIHAALGLDRSVLAVDVGGAPRSGMGALLAAVDAAEPALVVLSDLRTGLPGSTDEAEGGDGAAALLFGPGTVDAPVLAEVLGSAASTAEFLERWRLPGEPVSRVWEERFAETLYAPLAEEALVAALKAAGVTPEDVDHLVVCGSSARAVRSFARAAGVRTEAVAPDLTERIGNTGTAHPGIALADVLDRAEPGEVVVLVHLAEGAVAVVLRTTEALTADRHRSPVAAAVDGSHADLAYPTFLTWRGMLTRQPPRRPEPEPPAAPPAHRSTGFKLGFQASRCTACDTVNLPPARVCYSCGAVDRMDVHPMRETPGTVATFTVDRLAHTPSPPMIAVVVDFAGGGRFRCELADADPAQVRVGMPVELTFRRMTTTGRVHNYFWKARPRRGETA
jgi:3-hydroxy-3-methylglutaryl CoA synthase/uncharacterized OB-fold protein